MIAGANFIRDFFAAITDVIGGVHAVFERLLGEMCLDVVVIVNDIQNTAAGAVGQVRHRLIFLAAAHAARTFDVFQHNSLLFSKRCGDGANPTPADVGWMIWIKAP